MNKFKLEIFDLTPSQVQAGSFTLVLGEKEGDRKIPIIIGMFEAQAIAIELEKIKPTRPLTHDLVASFSRAFDFQVEEILITEIIDGIFYASILCTDGIRQKTIDARPSDAIALALRFKAPIFASQKVMEEAGVSSSDLEEPKSEKKEVKIKVSRGGKKPLKELSIEELKRLLDDALAKEDYETAAKIRDEIERRN